MTPLLIKRQRKPEIDAKQLLRAHVEQLPVDKQREFIAAAFQLLGRRNNREEAEIGFGYGQLRQEVKQ
jgi:hypothetical protein